MQGVGVGFCSGSVSLVRRRILAGVGIFIYTSLIISNTGVVAPRCFIKLRLRGGLEGFVSKTVVTVHSRHASIGLVSVSLAGAVGDVGCARADVGSFRMRVTMGAPIGYVSGVIKRGMRGNGRRPSGKKSLPETIIKRGLGHKMAPVCVAAICRVFSMDFSTGRQVRRSKRRVMGLAICCFGVACCVGLLEGFSIIGHVADITIEDNYYMVAG